MQRPLLLVLGGLAGLVASLASLAALSLALAPAPRRGAIPFTPREVPRGAPSPAAATGAAQVPRASPPPPPGQARASPPSPTVTVPAVTIHGSPARRLAARDDDVPWRCGPWTALASGPVTQTVRYCAASRVASTR